MPLARRFLHRGVCVVLAGLLAAGLAAPGADMDDSVLDTGEVALQIPVEPPPSLVVELDDDVTFDAGRPSSHRRTADTPRPPTPLNALALARWALGVGS